MANSQSTSKRPAKRPTAVKRRPPVKSTVNSPLMARWAAVKRWPWATLKPYGRFGLLWLVGWLTMMSFFFRNALDPDNLIDIFPHDFLFPMAMNAVTALIITLVIFWLSKYKSLLGRLSTVVILALLMVGYDGNLQSVAGLIRAVIPGMNNDDSLPFVSLVYLLVLLLLAIKAGLLIERFIIKRQTIKLRDAELGVLVMVAYLFLVPGISVARLMPNLIKQSSTQATLPTKPTNTAVASSSDKPDIYYIVLDRYTNANVLKTQFNYDNSSFTNYLTNSGFDVNNNAYNNYPYTAISISSTLAANYTNNLVAPYKNDTTQSNTLYHDISWNSPVIKNLKAAGYKYDLVGSWYATSYNSPLADNIYMTDHSLTLFGKQFRLEGIDGNEFTNSPYYRLAQMTNASWWPLHESDSDQVNNVRTQLSVLNDLATKGTPGGRFIFAHILVPHDPFFFNADGSLNANPSTDSYGEPVKQKYVNQVQFINSQMEQLVKNINQHSNGQSVIIINADEGAYPQDMNQTPVGGLDTQGAKNFDINDMTTWSNSWLQMKMGILQAVHIPRATPSDLNNLASVNLFRIILNRYAGYDLPYLPNCHFALNVSKANQYDYTDVTARLTGNPAPQCQQYQSIPSSKAALTKAANTSNADL